MASLEAGAASLPAALAGYPSDPSFHFMSMIQPLSGDNSVFGICLISGGGSMSILNKSKGGCRAERFSFFDRIKRITPRFHSIYSWPFFNSFNSVLVFSDQMFAVVGAQPDRFVLQIVHRA